MDEEKGETAVYEGCRVLMTKEESIPWSLVLAIAVLITIGAALCLNVYWEKITFVQIIRYFLVCSGIIATIYLILSFIERFDESEIE